MIEPSRRRALFEFVKPLEAGLDGAAQFGQVENRLAAVERLVAAADGLDRDHLGLLAVFFGLSRWLGRMGHESRTGIFLEGLGLSRAEIARLFAAVRRAESAPESREEWYVSDAARLEDVGALGLMRGIVSAHRERLELAEVAERLLEEQESVEFGTAEGRAEAESRIVAARSFCAQLRSEIEGR